MLGLTKEITQLIKRRNCYFKKAHSNGTGNSNDPIKFRQLRNKVVSKLRLAMQKFFSELEPSNTKEFWKKLSLLNSKECSIPTLSSGSTTAATSMDKATLLNATFAKSFNHSVLELATSDIPNVSPDDCPNNILCTEEEIFELLSTLDCSKANGHDDISARMLKKTALSITSAVTHLFNISLRLGEIPKEWKTARVSPIPKGTATPNPANY